MTVIVFLIVFDVIFMTIFTFPGFPQIVCNQQIKNSSI